MLHVTLFGYPTIGYVNRWPVFAANVMPTGRSAKLDAHQPTAIITPTARPVAGHGHLLCSGSPRDRRIHHAATTASTPITIQGEIPVTFASVGALPSASVSPYRWRARRSGSSTPTPTVVAPMANP